MNVNEENELREEITKLLAERDIPADDDLLDTLIVIIERRVETASSTEWLKGKYTGFQAGMQHAKTFLIEEAGRRFARGSDEQARFLRAFANEELTKEIARQEKS